MKDSRDNRREMKEQFKLCYPYSYNKVTLNSYECVIEFNYLYIIKELIFRLLLPHEKTLFLSHTEYLNKIIANEDNELNHSIGEKCFFILY